MRDRLHTDVADLIVPTPGVAIVDELDSVLVDEARVPLVLAGAVAEGESDRAITKIVRSLRAGAGVPTTRWPQTVSVGGGNMHLLCRH